MSSSNAVAVIDRDEPMELRTLPSRPVPSIPSPDDVKAMLAYGQMIADSKIFKNVPNAQAAVMIVRYGIQLGVDEFTALTQVFWINGVPTASAQLISSLIIRDHGGEAILPVEVTKDRVTISYKRREWSERREASYALADVPKILTDKDNWENYPADMLWARLVTRIGRQSFADTVRGLYTREEIEEGQAIEAQARVIERPDPVRGAPTPTARLAAMATEDADDDAMRIAEATVGDRKTEVSLLLKAVELAFNLAKQPAKMVTDTAENLICWRFGYQSGKEASAEDLAAVRAGIEGWRSANWVSQGIHWLEQVGAIEHEDSAIATGLLLDGAQVDDPFVHAALADRLLEFAQSGQEQLATIDAAVAAATDGIDGP